MGPRQRLPLGQKHVRRSSGGRSPKHTDCSGRGNTAAPGTNTRAPKQLREATWTYCCGRGNTAAPGMVVLAGRQLGTNIWRY